MAGRDWRKDVSPLLEQQMGPLMEAMAGERVTEVSVNREGELWVEEIGGSKRAIDAPWLTERWAWDLCVFLGNELDVPFSREVPILACQLPGGHRFHAVLGPNVRSGIAISVRVKRPFKASWEDFGLSEDHEWAQRIISTLREGRSVLISGGTYSGKTTLLNMLVTYIPAERRVLLAEDVPEIDLPHRDRVEYVVSRLVARTQVNWEMMLDCIVRQRPDVVGFGELSMDSTYPFIRAINTGHESGFTTLHANSPWLALKAAEQNVILSGHPGRGTISLLAKTLGLIVQVKRNLQTQRRVITDVVAPLDLPEVQRALAEEERAEVMA